MTNRLFTNCSDTLSCDSALFFAPAVLQKIRQVESVVQLRPPEIHAIRANREIGGLLWCRVFELSKFLARNQKPAAIAQAKHQELKTGFGPLYRLDDARKAVECLCAFERCIDLFVCRHHFAFSHGWPSRALPTRRCLRFLLPEYAERRCVWRSKAGLRPGGSIAGCFRRAAGQQRPGRQRIYRAHAEVDGHASKRRTRLRRTSSIPHENSSRPVACLQLKVVQERAGMRGGERPQR